MQRGLRFPREQVHVHRLASEDCINRILLDGKPSRKHNTSRHFLIVQNSSRGKRDRAPEGNATRNKQVAKRHDMASGKAQTSLGRECPVLRAERELEDALGLRRQQAEVVGHTSWIAEIAVLQARGCAREPSERAQERTDLGLTLG
jgi:hypothetical protein